MVRQGGNCDAAERLRTARLKESASLRRASAGEDARAELTGVIDEYFELGRADLARRAAREAFRIYSDDFELMRRLASARRQCQDWLGAMKLWEELAARDSTAFSAYLGAAEAACRSGRFSAAKIKIALALERFGSKPRLLRKLARSVSRSGAWAESLNIWRALLECAPDDVEAIDGAAAALCARGRYFDAIAFYRRYAADRPAQMQWRLRLVETLYDAFDWRAAADEAEIALAAAPDNQALRERRISILLDLRDFSQARDALGAMVEARADMEAAARLRKVIDDVERRAAVAHEAWRSAGGDRLPAEPGPYAALVRELFAADPEAAEAGLWAFRALNCGVPTPIPDYIWGADRRGLFFLARENAQAFPADPSTRNAGLLPLFMCGRFEDAASEIDGMPTEIRDHPALLQSRALTASLQQDAEEEGAVWRSASGSADDGWRALARLRASARAHREGEADRGQELFKEAGREDDAPILRVAPHEWSEQLAPFPGRRPADAGPRVALCLSGQLRGFRVAGPTIRKHIIEPLKADVFLHVWSDIGAGSDKVGRWDRALPRALVKTTPVAWFDAGEFERRFPQLRRRLDETEATGEEELDSLYGGCRAIVIEHADDSKDRHQGLNQSKMFYKIAACDDLRRNAEIDDRAPYDMVIRLRPDYFIKSFDPDEAWEAARSPNVLLTHAVQGPLLGLGDRWFLGGSAAMRAACAIWRWIDLCSHPRYLPAGRGAMAEMLLLDHALAVGLDPRSARGMIPLYMCNQAITTEDVLHALLADAMKNPALELTAAGQALLADLVQDLALTEGGVAGEAALQRALGAGFEARCGAPVEARARLAQSLGNKADALRLRECVQ